MKCGFKEWTEGWVGEVWARGEGKGRVRVYEAYAVKKKVGKLRCLLLRRKNIFLFVYL